MPRLRLRVVSTGVTYKLELPAGCTWAGLQAESRRAVGLPEDADVTLSLNKKTPLEGPPEGPLSSLGICGGDLVWLIGPENQVAGPSAAAGTCGIAAGVSSGRGNELRDNTPARNAAPAPSQTAFSAPAPLQQPAAPPSSSRVEVIAGGPQNNLPPSPAVASAAGQGELSACAQGASKFQKQYGDAALTTAGPVDVMSAGAGGCGGISDGAAMEVDPHPDGNECGDAGTLHGSDDEGAAGEDSDAAELVYPVGLRGMSLKLRRLLAPLMEETVPAGGGAAGSSGGGGVGYPPCSWASLPAASRCLLVLDCAMGEAGLQGLQDLPDLASRGGPLPRQLLYGCSYIAAAAAAAATSASAGDGVPDKAPSEGMTEAAGTCAGVAVGDTAGGGDRSVTAASSAVKLLWYGMGKFLVVHGVPCIGGGAASGGQAVNLTIDLAEYGAGGGAASAGPPPAAAAAAPTPPSASMTAAQQQQQQHQPQVPQVLQLPRDPAAHWRQLKDGLVLPLLAAGCRAAGLAPPLGMTVLPLELQMAVLRVLPARDLAVLSCACAALHRLASEDELWRPLYDKEFGPSLRPADAAVANSRGFKCLYGRKWRERAELRKRRHVPSAAPPYWRPPPLAPYMRPPYMPPGAIGGDYDRLPAPLGGIPPGFMGRGGAGGGMFPGALPGMGWRRGPGSGAGNPTFGYF